MYKGERAKDCFSLSNLMKENSFLNGISMIELCSFTSGLIFIVFAIAREISMTI
ncbi:MAG TPA: hypothetical protein PL110_16520 [Candidatus Eremiobacteraeota bacterium]|nr:hypothetical protein [Candidatus Eremiobacteraeota bacterium]